MDVEHLKDEVVGWQKAAETYKHTLRMTEARLDRSRSECLEAMSKCVALELRLKRIPNWIRKWYRASLLYK